mgnify:CR=1 FL=1
MPNRFRQLGISKHNPHLSNHSAMGSTTRNREIGTENTDGERRCGLIPTRFSRRDAASLTAPGSRPGQITIDSRLQTPEEAACPGYSASARQAHPANCSVI